MSDEPGLDPRDLNERVRLVCSLDVCSVCYELAGVTKFGEGRNKTSPQIKSARFKNEFTSMRPLLLNSGREISRVCLHNPRRPHSSIYIRQRIRISVNIHQDEHIEINPSSQVREPRGTHEKPELQGENSSLSRPTMPRFHIADKSSRTRILRSYRVAQAPDTRYHSQPWV